MRKKTVFNIAIMALILSFFITPLGDYSKVLLNKLFSFSPHVTKEVNRERVMNYNWKLKDADWRFFNFKKSKGKVVFINFWRSWIIPSHAELVGIQKLYDDYKGKVDFYIITNEEREPVETFMEEQGFTFPITYSIEGDPMPVDGSKPPRSYLLDRDGSIVINKEGVADWDNDKVKSLIDKLLAK